MPAPLDLVLPPVRATFRAAAEAIAALPAPLAEQDWRDVEALVEDALAPRPAALRRQLRLFLRALEWASVLRYRRRFSRLDVTRRERVLRWLEGHPIELLRVGLWGLRALVFLGVYGRPAAARAIGYRPDVRGWAALASAPVNAGGAP